MVPLLVGLLGLLPLQLSAQTTDPDSLDFPLLPDPQDTTVKDSVPRKVVGIKTEILDPLALMNGEMLRTAVAFKPEQVMYHDILDRVGGIATTLGQWGLPYQRFKYGTDAANFDQGQMINPITGAENLYMLDPEHGMPYYDTRTPYLNAYYGQGKADAVQMRVDVSQNVHPLVNVTGLYLRRQCKGFYTNHVTDQNTVGLSSNFHTLNERYQVYAHVLVQQSKDQVNGGVLPTSDFVLFGGSSQSVALSGANLLRGSKAISVRQFYRLLGDSAQTKHTLTAYALAYNDVFQNRFYDKGLSTAASNDTFPVYQTIGFKPYLYENMLVRRLKLDAGLSYRLNSGNWTSGQRLEFAHEWLQFIKNGDTVPYGRNTILWKGTLVHNPVSHTLEAQWTYRLTQNSLFRPETYAEVEVAYRVGDSQNDYSYRVSRVTADVKDSVTVYKSHRPIGLVMHTLSYGRNPTMQQSYGTGTFGSLFVSNPNFSNRRINHFSLGIELVGKSRWSQGGEIEGNRLRLSAFTTRQSGIIYYDGGHSFVQAAPNDFVNYAGGELKVRVHLWKKLFVETETVAQAFSSNNKTLTAEFQSSQPRFYSKTSIFYDNRDLKFTKSLRFGLDYWYFNTFDVPLYEPSLQAFYAQGSPQIYSQFAYPRADVWVTTQVKRVHIFVKFINLLEGLPQLGYFTTVGYPMPVRQLQLGLNWTFFD
jgi:Putative porin